jgi:hypothetical protein
MPLLLSVKPSRPTTRASRWPAPPLFWNPGARLWLNRMTRKVLYESANGDIWWLVRDPQSGGALVEHQPNASSGGRTSLTDIGQFLRADGRGPEHQALLALIGTLVDD